ncbi:MAG: tetratricopeptide repeat protein [Planctomycetes bacterium]|nr:tetratricopeptide repeat protein [Planctomycetota bacterium]
MRESKTIQDQTNRGTTPGWGLPLLIVAAGIIAYWNSLDGAFVFDDAQNIVTNEQIHRLWRLSEVLGGRRSVVDLTLAINYAVGRLDVRGYHIVNLAIHVLAGMTLFGIVRRTLRGKRLLHRFGQASPWLALATALIWVVHPLQTQSVSYIIQRAESLMGLFYLLVLYCVIRGATSPRRSLWYGAAVVACGLGMGSKGVMVTAPVLVLLYDRVFLAESLGEVRRRRWALYVGLAATWGILAACGVITGVLDPTADPDATVGFSYKGVSPLAYALTQPGVILHYLALTFWPRGQCIDYGWPVAQTARAIAWPMIIILPLLLGTLGSLYRWRPISFLGVWFFLILAPTSSFIPITDLAFEHRMYLPLAAVVSLMTITGYQALRFLSGRTGVSARATRGLTIVLVAGVVVALGSGTIRRNQVYRSGVALWTDTIAHCPDNPRGYVNLAVEYNNIGKDMNDQGRFNEAIDVLEKACRTEPRLVGPHYNLGNALKAGGRLDDAIQAYRRAIEIEPDHTQAHYNLGHALLQTGDLAGAIDHHRAATQIDPEFADAFTALGVGLLRQQQLAEAVDAFQTALRLKPNDAMIHTNLGHALLTQGRVAEALTQYYEALRLDPRDPNAHYHIGMALGAQGRINEAIERFQEALRIQPNHVPAQQALARLLSQRRPMTE